MKTYIESDQNKIFKLYLSLLKASGIKKHKQFLLMGKKFLDEKLNSNVIHSVIVSENDTNSLPFSNNKKIVVLKPSLFKQLDIYNTESPLLVGYTEDFPNYISTESNKIVVLCAFNDPSNLGAFLRSALAFNVENVVLLEECVTPYHCKALRASSSHSLDLKFYKGPSIKSLVLPNLYALDLKGENISLLSKNVFQKPFHLLIGEEGQGIPKHLKLNRLTIEQNPKAESLNATVAASIALWQIYQLQR